MRNLLFAGICLFLVFPHPADAQRSRGEQPQATQTTNNNDEAFNKLIEDAVKYEGFFDLYQKDDKLYMAVKADQLDYDFLLSFQIGQGIGSAGLYAGTMLSIFEPSVVAFEKREGRLFLTNKQHRYRAEEGTPQELAVNLNYGSSVLETARVEATNSNGTMLISVYDWFVGDLSNISSRVQSAVSNRPGTPGRATFDRSRSYVESVKSFPMNTNIVTNLTFRNAEPSAPRTVADSRFIPVGIHYTMAQLPEVPMSPRLADDRLGYFMTVHKDFTETDDTFFRRYINKWRLECDGPAGSDGLCEPKKPITYYIDHSVPERYRKPMMEGVEAWSEAFVAAGFRNAVRAEMLPEGADPQDIRYATLRWNVSDQPGYGAIGPSIVDPRTGEILDADMLYEANMIQGFRNTYRQQISPQQAVEEMYIVTEEEMELMKRGIKTESFFAEMATQGDLIRSSLMLRDEINAGDPVPDEYVDEAVRWVTMHEVGHTLGLRHNFRSSIDTPNHKLHDKEWAKTRGVFNSAMEYPTPNVAPKGQEQGHFYNPTIGSYDRWVISYGYTPDDDRAAEIARLAAQPGHAYGTDEDTRGAGAIDPTINVYDLGEDPLQWGRERADLIRAMIPNLPEQVLKDNTPYYELTDLFQSLFFQYGRALAPTVKYIGGQYQYRDHVGDPDGRRPFEPVELEKQQEALDMIINYAFAADAFVLPQEVYQLFGANRWSHWGESNTYQGRIDYPLHNVLLGVQTGLLNQLLNGTRLNRIRDTEVKFGAENTITIPELMSTVSEAIWSEVWNSPGGNVPSNRRDLQREHLDAMIGLVTNAPGNTPADVRSVARVTLQDLHDRLNRRLAPPTYSFDAYSRAHLIESRFRIQQALEAGFSLSN